MLTQKLLSLALVGTEWIIWFLLFLSVISLAIILEKILLFREKRGDIQALTQKMNAILRNRNYIAMENVLRSDRSSLTEVARRAIGYMNSGMNDEDSVSMALSEEKIALETRTAVLGTMGANAPFIGLFGTVLGIIHAFHSLSMNTKDGPSAIMAGISEALIATALGLFVAIPAVAAYNYFMRSIKKLMVASENFTRLVMTAYSGMALKKDYTDGKPRI